MIYGRAGVSLFCDIVPRQPDAVGAAMKMCLSVIRLFNLSERTGLSVRLTLANPRPGAHTQPHYMCAHPKYFPSREKIFLESVPKMADTEVGQTCGGESFEMGLIFEPTIHLINPPKV